MKELRIFKRYQNRKLYDTFESCYVTLSEIAEIIRQGNEIQVVDKKTNCDITYKTIIQILCDEERKSLHASDTAFLNRVIRSEEGLLTGYVRTLEAKTSVVADTEFRPLPATTVDNSLGVNL